MKRTFQHIQEILELTDKEGICESEYRTIVGKIMYLTYKLVLEGLNAAREMSKFYGRTQKQQ